ncbi:MAG: rRNA methyltransferase [Rhodanobacteraceae bacterium]|nr:rRNA methyltransferase [Rhodanobacteraceae bacterium]
MVLPRRSGEAPRDERIATRRDVAAVAPRRHEAARLDATARENRYRGTADSPETGAPPQLQQRHEELRVFGINACAAAFARRPQDLRKAYLTEQRIAQFKPLLAWCVQQRLGYRVVADADLAKLTASQHHEGVCLEMRRQPALSLQALIGRLPAAPAPAVLVVLDGVGNPHNFGAVLRSAANFGVAGVVLPPDSPLTLSGAACRVAEGGAEVVALARPLAGEDLSALLREAGFSIVATVPRSGVPLYGQVLPARIAFVFGAENDGMSADWIAAADRRLTIPGTGAVESLNIAASAAVLFAEHYRQYGATA